MAEEAAPFNVARSTPCRFPPARRHGFRAASSPSREWRRARSPPCAPPSGRRRVLRIAPRSGAGVRRHVSKPCLAAATARSRSSAPERGNRPMRSLWRAGLRFSKYWPVAGSTHSPPMKFLKVSAMVGFGSDRVRGSDRARSGDRRAMQSSSRAGARPPRIPGILEDARVAAAGHDLDYDRSRTAAATSERMVVQSAQSL